MAVRVQLRCEVNYHAHVVVYFTTQLHLHCHLHNTIIKRHLALHKYTTVIISCVDGLNVSSRASTQVERTVVHWQC